MTTQQDIPDETVTILLRIALHFSHHLEREVLLWEEIPPFQLILSEAISVISESTLINFLVNYFTVFNYNLAFSLEKSGSILTVHLNSFFYEPDVIFFNFFSIYRITETLVMLFRKSELSVRLEKKSIYLSYDQNFVNTTNFGAAEILNILQKFLDFINDVTLLFQVQFTPNHIYLMLILTGIEYPLP